MGKSLTHIARLITRQNKMNVVSGGFALAMYYKHRVPADIDVWNYTGDKLPFEIKFTKKVNKWLTRYTTKNGISIDTVRPGHRLNRIMYPPVYADLIRMLDKRDLLAHTVHSIVNNHKPVKKTAYVDLFYMMQDFAPAQIIAEYKKHYPEDNGNIAQRLTAFDKIKNEPDPELINCNCDYYKALRTIKTKFK